MLLKIAELQAWQMHCWPRRMREFCRTVFLIYLILALIIRHSHLSNIMLEMNSRAGSWWSVCVCVASGSLQAQHLSNIARGFAKPQSLSERLELRLTVEPRLA